MSELEDLAAVAKDVRGRAPRPAVNRGPGAGVWVGVVVAAVAIVAAVAFFVRWPGVGLVEYRGVREGMSYAEVRDVCGSAGELVESSSGGDAKPRTASYVWRDHAGGVLRVDFVGDKVVTKSQQGLR